MAELEKLTLCPCHSDPSKNLPYVCPMRQWEATQLQTSFGRCQHPTQAPDSDNFKVATFQSKVKRVGVLKEYINLKNVSMYFRMVTKRDLGVWLCSNRIGWELCTRESAQQA